MINRQFLSALAAALVAFSVRAPAQTAPGRVAAMQTPTLRTSVTTIEVDAVVTRDGSLVRDLTADDFEIVQDGRPQRITAFTYVSVDGTDPETAAARLASSSGGAAAPAHAGAAAAAAGQQGRHLVFVVDDLGLGHEDIHRVKTMLRQVVETQIGPQDQVAIVRTGGEAGLFQQFTADTAVLRTLVERIRFNMAGRGLADGTLTLDEAAIPMTGRPEPEDPRADSSDPSRTIESMTGARKVREGLDLAFATGTIGTINAVVASLRDVPGRKGVVLLTGGFSLDAPGVLTSLRPIVDLATRTRTVIYAVNVPRFNPTLAINAACCKVNPSRFQDDVGTQVIFKSRNALDELQSLKQGPDFLAGETGGHFFANPSDLALVVTRSIDDQRGYYLLGYSPDDRTFADRADRFHKITVRVRKPGYSVRARSGFLGDPSRRAVPPRPSALSEAALSAFSRNELDVRVSAFFMAPDGASPMVRVLVHFDRDRIRFVRGEDGTDSAEVEVEAYAVDSQGVVVGQDRQTMRIREAGGASATEAAGGTEADKVGFLYRLDVPVERPGAYALRLGLRDRATGALGSASQFVMVPELKRDRLALSGLLVGAGGDGASDARAATVHPAVRRFAVPSRLTYSLQIYNARYRDGAPALRATAEILQDDRRVYAGPALDVQTSAARGQPITVAGVLALGAGFAPGRYALRVSVSDLNDQAAPAISTVVDFSVENGASRAEAASDRRN